jgi:hypothetical protein
MSKNLVKSNKEKNVILSDLETLQNVFIENNHIEGIYGDGKNLVNNELFRIENDFADQLYMRKMYMPEQCVVISANHHTEHFWFLMYGRILVTTNGEQVEHIAPCYEKSIKGAKRLILSLEDSLFINVHKNPTNTKDMKEVEESLYSITIEEYNKKEKLWQE